MDTFAMWRRWEGLFVPPARALAKAEKMTASLEFVFFFGFLGVLLGFGVLSESAPIR